MRVMYPLLEKKKKKKVCSSQQTYPICNILSYRSVLLPIYRQNDRKRSMVLVGLTWVAPFGVGGVAIEITTSSVEKVSVITITY